MAVEYGVWLALALKELAQTKHALFRYFQKFHAALRVKTCDRNALE